MKTVGNNFVTQDKIITMQTHGKDHTISQIQIVADGLTDKQSEAFPIPAFPIGNLG